MSKKKVRRVLRESQLTTREAAKLSLVRRRIAEELPAIAARARARRDGIMDLVAQLKRERRRQGLTLAEMRLRTGMERSALSRLENKPGNPTVNTLQRYAQAVGKRLVIRFVEDESANGSRKPARKVPG